VFIFACNDNDKLAGEIEKIHVDLNISRFDREFAHAQASDIPVLREKYPYLFPAPDSVWVAKLSDTLQIELLSEVGKAYADFDAETFGLIQLFKHIKFYFPDYRIPRVITVVNDVDYQNRIMLNDTVLFIELDSYLGPDHKFYGGFPKYIAKGLDARYLISDVASAVAKKLVPRPNDRSFLSQMIYYGKELYLKDKIMPSATNAQKIGYSEDEFAWAQANEEAIWRNFIEQEYLYSTDRKLGPRFLDPAPFSKFGLELDNESPGRLGRYMGWQIVRSFMERNSITLQQLMNLPAEEIFKKANYKPEK
jgi:gliding motility-associated lipoprotein GldB